MSKVTFPPQLREHLDTIAAWDRKAIEWLGLDPTAVLSNVKTNINDLDRERGQFKPPAALWISWTVWGNQEPPKPSRGDVHPWSFTFGDVEEPVWTGLVYLDWDDEAALVAEVGPRPRVMPVETELQLRGLASLRR